jgi:hypothetical protein
LRTVFIIVVAPILILSVCALLGGRSASIRDIPFAEPFLPSLGETSSVRYAYYHNYRDHCVFVSGFAPYDSLNQFAKVNGYELFESQEMPSSLSYTLSKMRLKSDSGIDTNFGLKDVQIFGKTDAFGLVEVRYRRKTGSFTLLKTGRN